MKLSVILCTRNPRAAHLGRTLGALRVQTLPPSDWELILSDNGSSPPLSARAEVESFPDARIVAEPEPGFTPALLRALPLAAADVVLLLHDDNVLPPDYLERLVVAAARWPELGAWGGGYRPEYEETPAPELAPYLAYLAVNPVPAERWSNGLHDYAATPCGAGMAVRTAVLRRWAELLGSDARRRRLGRHTDKLTSCEDFDIAFTAVESGYRTAVFPDLELTHLMPQERVQRAYLQRLVEGHAYSTVLLHSFRNAATRPARGPLARLRRWRLRRTWDTVRRELQASFDRGEARAWAELDRNG